MPSKVRSHWAQTKYGWRTRVRSYTRYGPEHSAKWKRLVSELRVQRHPPVRSPEAVATAILGRMSFSASERRKLSREKRGR